MLGVGQSRIRLYNNTAASQVAIGQGSGPNSGSVRFTQTLPWTRFTANGSDAYQIEVRGTATRATDGMGEQDGMTIGVEVYLTIFLIKIA